MPEAPSRLPRGRHNLSREEVAESQMMRMLVATIEVVGTEGFAQATVTKILRRASVSRETFYANFDNKQAALNAAYQQASDELRDAVVAQQVALPADAAPLERIDAALGAYLDQLQRHEPLARALLVEIYAAGPESVALAVAARQRFVELAVAVLGEGTPGSRFACEAYLAAASGVATQLAITGRSAEIESLREPLSGLARAILSGSQHWQ